MTAIINNLNQLPEHSHVFIDTNIFYLHLRGKSKSCTEFLEKVNLGSFLAYVNFQVLSDLLHKLMLAEAYQKGFISRLSATHLKAQLEKNRGLTRQLTHYQTPLAELLQLPSLMVLPMEPSLLLSTKQERDEYGLMTTDSLHLGSMNRHSPPLTNLVTYDSDFEHIVGLTIWKPMDVV